MTENTLADKLEHVTNELQRINWHVDPIDWTAPDSVLAARLAHEEARLRAWSEQFTTISPPPRPLRPIT
jgi:hypothetical protein